MLCNEETSDVCFRLSTEKTNKLINKIENISTRKGFEFHPFKIGWYNDRVQKPFVLPYCYDTLAVLVVNTPSMFENYFLPFVDKHQLWNEGGGGGGSLVPSVRDPIDECIAEHLQRISKILSNDEDYQIEIVHDYDMLPNRRPKMLCQTAAHVSGAAYFYQKSDIRLDDDNPFDRNNNSKRIFGVCIHPKYGGWFALRGIMIFKNVLCSDLNRIEPQDVVSTNEMRIELLTLFNYHWQDWTYRDVVPSAEKYSVAQKLYFQTKPADRKKLLQTSPLFRHNWNQ